MEDGSLGRCLTIGGKNISVRRESILRKQRRGMIWLNRSSWISKEPQMWLKHGVWSGREIPMGKGAFITVTVWYLHNWWFCESGPLLWVLGSYYLVSLTSDLFVNTIMLKFWLKAVRRGTYIEGLYKRSFILLLCDCTCGSHLVTMRTGDLMTSWLTDDSEEERWKKITIYSSLLSVAVIKGWLKTTEGGKGLLGFKITVCH